MMLGKSWFGIKQVDLARPALHAEVNDRCCPRRKMRLLGDQVQRFRRVGNALPGKGGSSIKILREQGSQRSTKEAIGSPIKKVAAVNSIRHEMFVFFAQYSKLIHVQKLARIKQGLAKVGQTQQFWGR